MNVEQLKASGFELCSTGGGFWAYSKMIAPNRVIFVCDNDSQPDDLSDDNFIVELHDYEDGSPIACVTRYVDKTDAPYNSTTKIEIYNYTDETLLPSTFSPYRIVDALAAFGVVVQS